MGSKPHDRFVREPDEARPEKRRCAQIRGGIGQVAQHGYGILDLVGLEEAEPLVDVGRHTAAFERSLELPVALAGTEQDGDVRRLCRANDAGPLVPNGRSIQQAHDFVGHGLGGETNRGPDDQAERNVVGLQTPGSGLRLPGSGLLNIGLQRESIELAVPERVGTACLVAFNRAEHIVDEPEQRRHRPEADGQRTPRPSGIAQLGAQGGDEPCGLVEQGDLGVAKPVNRLLAIADDEDRGRQRVGRRAQPFAPTSYQLLHQIPLRPARVLKLIDEHVVVPRLQAVSAAGELVHPFQQVDGPFEHARKIEERAGVEGVAVLGGGHRKHPPDAARQHDVQISPEGVDGVGDRRRDGRRRGPMLFPCGLRVAMGRSEHGSGEPLATRFAVLCQKIAAQPIRERAKRRLPGARVEVGCSAGLHACARRTQCFNIPSQQRKLRVADRA